MNPHFQALRIPDAKLTSLENKLSFLTIRLLDVIKYIIGPSQYSVHSLYRDYSTRSLFIVKILKSIIQKLKQKKSKNQPSQNNVIVKERTIAITLTYIERIILISFIDSYQLHVDIRHLNRHFNGHSTVISTGISTIDISTVGISTSISTGISTDISIGISINISMGIQ